MEFYKEEQWVGAMSRNYEEDLLRGPMRSVYWKYLHIYAISRNNLYTCKSFLQYFWLISKAGPKNIYAISKITEQLCFNYEDLWGGCMGRFYEEEVLGGCMRRK